MSSALMNDSLVKTHADEIRSELELILASSAFRNSKRHNRFLRFIVEQTLSGHSDEIKERVIGIEVFDRNPGYDLTSDPIVRVAAGDIRKRLAQYYGGQEHAVGIRFSLPTGSYVPAFALTSSPPPGAPVPAEVFEAANGLDIVPPVAFDLTPKTSAANKPRPGFAAMVRIAVMCGLACILFASIFFGYRHFAERDLDDLWRPLWGGNQEAVICVGDLNFLMLKSSTPPPDLSTKLEVLQTERNHVGQNDVYALARVAEMFGRHDKNFKVMLADDTTLTDLRSQPAVLVGAFTNQWTTRLLSNTRFQFHRDPVTKIGILTDASNLKQISWSVNADHPIGSIHEDYGLITKIAHPLTGQVNLIIGGLGPYGTVAASEFATNPRYFSQFISQALLAGEKKTCRL